MTRWTPRPDGGQPSGKPCSHTWTADPPPLSETCASCEAREHAPADLLLCLTCGHVGCSDSSRGAHATAHFDSSAHPVARTLASGRAWAWCYEDEMYLDPLEKPVSRSTPRPPESV
ncbi:UBP-type zinc finger domain-containing protein [Streptomyces pilosus]